MSPYVLHLCSVLQVHRQPGALKGASCPYSLFSDENTEAQRDCVPCFLSHRWHHQGWTSLSCNPRGQAMQASSVTTGVHPLRLIVEGTLESLKIQIPEHHLRPTRPKPSEMVSNF